MADDPDYTVDKLHESKQVTLSDDRALTKQNVVGHVTSQPDYKFEAKVYDFGSKFGIDGGRISDLRVKKNDQIVLEYLRGREKVTNPSPILPSKRKSYLKSKRTLSCMLLSPTRCVLDSELLTFCFR